MIQTVVITHLVYNTMTRDDTNCCNNSSCIYYVYQAFSLTKDGNTV